MIPGFKLVMKRNLLTRRWGGELVIYNCLSGDTHLLDSEMASFFDDMLTKTSEQRKEIVVMDKQNKIDERNLHLQTLLKLKLI